MWLVQSTGMKTKWIDLAIRLADAAAKTSEDQFVKVGAAVLRIDGSVCGVGYNGYPPGFDLTKQESYDRDYRRDFMVHAEINALAYCKPGEPHILAVTYPPCKACVLEAARYGVKNLIYRENEKRPIFPSDYLAARLGLTLISEQ
jgi:deoxycytidylate deaminase